ncbi:MAG: hypothetical protein ABIO43_02955 [Sphingomicrobium sp.]
MSQSNSNSSAQPESVADSSSSMPDDWVDKDETSNPAPGHRTKDSRDTAAGCRDRASKDLIEAITMNTANGRQVLEKSAASWTKRAELLQRIESGIEARTSQPELTASEIDEDAEHLRQ